MDTTQHSTKRSRICRNDIILVFEALFRLWVNVEGLEFHCYYLGSEDRSPSNIFSIYEGRATFGGGPKLMLAHNLLYRNWPS